MRKSRFTEAQIIGMTKEQKAGMPTAEVCRKHGHSQGTFYTYKSKYGGMEVSDVAKLRAMEDENAQLKRLLADAMFDRLEDAPAQAGARAIRLQQPSRDLATQGPAGLWSGRTHRSATKHPQRRIGRLSSLRAPRPARLPNQAAKNMKTKPADSCCE